MEIDSNIIIFPNNEQELINMYLDKTEHRTLWERLNMSVKASDEMECSELKKQIFQAALEGFAHKVCEEQRLITENNFMNAPTSEEWDALKSSPYPDIYDREQYLRLENWWRSLNESDRIGVARQFESDFDSIPDDSDPVYYCNNRWLFISKPDREKIYNHFNK